MSYPYVQTTQDNQPKIISSYTYSPYGIETAINQDQKATTHKLFGFDGQLTDPQTGWQFLGKGYRAYNPLLHRFMRQDSMSPFDKGGINGYVFSNNNPIMQFDPSGHFAIGALIGVLPIIGDLYTGVTAAMSGAWGWAAASVGTLALNFVGEEEVTTAIKTIGLVEGSLEREALADTAHIAACFTGETKVTLAGNKKQAIQNIKLRTWIAAPKLPIGAKKQFTQPSYDSIPITPKTWEEVDLVYYSTIHGHQYANSLQILRLIAWLHKQHMDTIGTKVLLSIPEFGIVNVIATVKTIKPTQLDTRGVDWSTSAVVPVIGKSKRYVTDVRLYTFKNLVTGEITHVQATPQHYFYVQNQHRFLPIQSVSDQDKLLGKAGEPIQLVCVGRHRYCGKRLKDLAHPIAVYTLETYRRHRYQVGVEQLIVHNICTAAIQQKINTIEDIANIHERYAAYEEILQDKKIVRKLNPYGIANLHYNRGLDGNAIAKTYVVELEDLIAKHGQRSQFVTAHTYLSEAIRNMDQAARLYTREIDKNLARTLSNSWKETLAQYESKFTLALPELRQGYDMTEAPLEVRLTEDSPELQFVKRSISRKKRLSLKSRWKRESWEVA